MKKVVLIIGLVFAVNQVLKAQNTKEDEQAITGIVQTLQSGWNEKNGEKFASSFADVHDYIVVYGMYLPGFTKVQNAKAHQQLFDGPYKTSQLKLQADKIRFYRSDLAQLTIIGGNYQKDQAIPKDPSIIMTLIVEKQKEGWKIISFHNHELNMEAIRKASPMPLEAMYASWYKQ